MALARTRQSLSDLPPACIRPRAYHSQIRLSYPAQRLLPSHQALLLTAPAASPEA